ncbi:YceI family protein [Photobacterium sanctipauli]|uniref:YceI family protein n=1 Tax=Photobacterium sanctipauli TaxID=1342794 RepID=A0A2T3NUD1_9GAMM|nr:YceI family protein [Photobacterium sanctipauli]PSW19862.1 YceI family protein [Photobacterium sanctipauli]
MAVKNSIFVLGAIFTLCSATSAWANWSLDGPKSTIGFSSVKNDSVLEQHTFRNLSGAISDAGDVKLSIDLTSVDTNIQIRDERMKKELFETEKHPLTMLVASVDSEALSSMSPGKTMETDIEFELDLHGKKQKLGTRVQVTGLENGGLQVTTLKPVEVKSAQFGLDTGIDKLKDIAKLNSILLTVPVSANLIFVAEE